MPSGGRDWRGDWQPPGAGSPPDSSEGAWPCDTLISDSRPPDSKRINFCCWSLPVCASLLWPQDRREHRPQSPSSSLAPGPPQGRGAPAGPPNPPTGDRLQNQPYLRSGKASTASPGPPEVRDEAKAAVCGVWGSPRGPLPPRAPPTPTQGGGPPALPRPRLQVPGWRQP